MTEHLDQARVRRASIRSGLGTLERALAAPAHGRSGTWSAELIAAVDGLAAQIEQHISSTEAPDGLLADIVEEAPRLAHRVDLLKDEHHELRELIDKARSALPADDAGIADARDRCVDVMRAIVRHRQAGADLVYEAFNVDMEASD